MRTPEEPLFDKIEIVQTYSFCPFECSLNQSNMGQMQPWSRDIFQSWNPFSGEFTLLSNDKSLAETMMLMMVSCRSTLSNNQSIAQSAFAIALQDECKFARVNPPRQADMIVDLFIAKQYNYPEATVSNVQGESMDCGYVSTRLVGVEPNYPDIIHTPEVRELSIIADDESHLDTFPLVFESCITYKGDPAHACRNSTVFRIEVVNPCDTSTILSKPIPSSLSARITELDGMDLR